MRNQRVLFGQTHFGPAHLYRLRSDQGLEVEISDWGLALRQVLTPVEQGPSQPWLLGMRSIADYIQPHPWLGTVVGRVANRIRGASFHDGRRRWTLPANERTHLLHGGSQGLHAVLWTGELEDLPGGGRVTFRHHSPHGTGGFPGALELEVSVSVLARSLRLDFRAQSDRRTPVSLTHHAYWRLWPDAAVGDHHLQVHADRWTPVDVEGCSTGELRSVEGGPMDFRSTRSMAEIIGGLGGLDHNLLVPGAPQLRELARLTHGASGRCLITRSTLPGLQIYTAERMDEGQVDAQGRPLGPEGAICLEPQLPPGGVHHAHFPSPWLEPGEVWEESIEWECLG